MRARLSFPLLGLAAALSFGCGGAEDSLSLGMDLAFSPSAAVPTETIAAFEVGVVQNLTNNNCGPFLTSSVTDEAAVCPETLEAGRFLELRDDNGRAVRKKRVMPALSEAGRQSLSVEVPVGAANSLLIQAVDANGSFLGSTCTYLGRVSISGVEFNNRTIELHLNEAYADCQAVIP